MLGNSRYRRVSMLQLDILWEHLNTHRDIATGYNRTLQAKEYSRKAWKDIAMALNAQGDGSHKEWNEWSKYWIDYKAKLKKKVSSLRLAQSVTGGGPSTAESLTDIELKFLEILGSDFGQGLPGVRVEPYTEDQIRDADVQPEIILSISCEDIPPQSIVQLDHGYTPAEPPPEPSSETQDIIVPNTSGQHSPQQTPVISRTTRRRRGNRESNMTQESARRSLVESSRIRAEAARRSSIALESINDTLGRIERCI